MTPPSSGHEHPPAMDAFPATVVFGISLLAPVLDDNGDTRPLTLQGAFYAAVICASLTLRRRRPTAVLAVTASGTAAGFAVTGHKSPLMPATVIAMCTCALHRSRREAVPAVAAAAVPPAGASVVFGHRGWTGPEVVALSALSASAAAVGFAVRNRRAYVAAVEERARAAQQPGLADGERTRLRTAPQARAACTTTRRQWWAARFNSTTFSRVGASPRAARRSGMLSRMCAPLARSAAARAGASSSTASSAPQAEPTGCRRKESASTPTSKGSNPVSSTRHKAAPCRVGVGRDRDGGDPARGPRRNPLRLPGAGQSGVPRPGRGPSQLPVIHTLSTSPSRAASIARSYCPSAGLHLETDRFTVVKLIGFSL